MDAKGWVRYTRRVWDLLPEGMEMLWHDEPREVRIFDAETHKSAHITPDEVRMFDIDIVKMAILDLLGKRPDVVRYATDGNVIHVDFTRGKQ